MTVDWALPAIRVGAAAVITVVLAWYPSEPGTRPDEPEDPYPEPDHHPMDESHH